MRRSTFLKLASRRRPSRQLTGACPPAHSTISTCGGSGRSSNAWPGFLQAQVIDLVLAVAPGRRGSGGRGWCSRGRSIRFVTLVTYSAQIRPAQLFPRRDVVHGAGAHHSLDLVRQDGAWRGRAQHVDHRRGSASPRRGYRAPRAGSAAGRSPSPSRCPPRTYPQSPGRAPAGGCSRPSLPRCAGSSQICGPDPRGCYRR